MERLFLFSFQFQSERNTGKQYYPENPEKVNLRWIHVVDSQPENPTNTRHLFHPLSIIKKH